MCNGLRKNRLLELRTNLDAHQFAILRHGESILAPTPVGKQPHELVGPEARAGNVALYRHKPIQHFTDEQITVFTTARELVLDRLRVDNMLQNRRRLAVRNCIALSQTSAPPPTNTTITMPATAFTAFITSSASHFTG